MLTYPSSHNLAWTSPYDAPFGWQIQQSSVSGGPYTNFTLVAGTARSSFVAVTGVYYVIAASDGSGGLGSPISNQVFAT